MNMNCEKNFSNNPVLFIQPDWNITLSEPDGKAWISCKYKDEAGIYGTIKKETNDEGVSSLTVTDDFIIEKSGINFIMIKHKNSKSSTYFLKPIKCLTNLHKTSVTSMSIAPNGLAVSSSSDETLILWNAYEGNTKRNLTGHVGEVYKCRFFPSGIVVFTAGMDMSLKIWCAKTGRCPVTFVGHTMAVTDVAFVDRGKNVLSCGKDGCLKLWNCADSSCIYNIVELQSPINCCSLGLPSSKLNLGEPKHEISSKEVSTEGKIVLLGCEDGTVRCIALRSHKELFSINTGSVVNCVTFLTNNEFIIGCQNGSVYLYNVESVKEPKFCWNESNSAVLSVLNYNNLGFFLSRADGTVEFNFIKRNPLIKICLTGADCDPIYDIATDGKDVFTCCRDSKIRRYRVADLIRKLYTS